MSTEEPRISDHPVLAGVLITGTMAVVFAGLALLTTGTVDIAQTLLFAVVFAVVYVGVSVYREQ